MSRGRQVIRQWRLLRAIESSRMGLRAADLKCEGVELPSSRGRNQEIAMKIYRSECINHREGDSVPYHCPHLTDTQSRET